MSLSEVNFTYMDQPKMNTWPIFQELAFLEAELFSLFTSPCTNLSHLLSRCKYGDLIIIMCGKITWRLNTAKDKPQGCHTSYLVRQQHKSSGNQRALELCEWNQGSYPFSLYKRRKYWIIFQGRKQEPHMGLCAGVAVYLLHPDTSGSVLLELKYPSILYFLISSNPIPSVPLMSHAKAGAPLISF